MGKRELVARVLAATGLLRLALACRRRAGSTHLPILTFHRVRESVASFALDDEVIDATPVEFDRRMAIVERYFTPVGIEELVAHLHGAPLPRNPIVISFDDGYRDNHDIALPILRAHGIKAVFFIATSYITQRRLFWWDRINYLINHSPRTAIEITYPQSISLDLTDRRAAKRRLLRVVKQSCGLDLTRMLDELAAAAAVPWDGAIERELADEHVMTWDHVRALRAAGMDVESHTRRHLVLQTLGEDEIADELVGSRDDLERELHVVARAISYPVGHSIGDRDDLRSALAHAGYQLGFTNASGASPLGPRLDCFEVQRLGMDAGTSDALFGAVLAAPRIFA